MDGIEGARESVVSIRGRFSRSRASLHRIDRANGNHDREVKRLWNRDRKIANDPRGSRRKNKLIDRCKTASAQYRNFIVK